MLAPSFHLTLCRVRQTYRLPLACSINISWRWIYMLYLTIQAREASPRETQCALPQYNRAKETQPFYIKPIQIHQFSYQFSSQFHQLIPLIRISTRIPSGLDFTRNPINFSFLSPNWPLNPVLYLVPSERLSQGTQALCQLLNYLNDLLPQAIAD